MVLFWIRTGSLGVLKALTFPVALPWLHRGEDGFKGEAQGDCQAGRGWTGGRDSSQGRVAAPGKGKGLLAHRAQRQRPGQEAALCSHDYGWLPMSLMAGGGWIATVGRDRLDGRWRSCTAATTAGWMAGRSVSPGSSPAGKCALCAGRPGGRNPAAERARSSCVVSRNLLAAGLAAGQSQTRLHWCGPPIDRSPLPDQGWSWPGRSWGEAFCRAGTGG